MKLIRLRVESFAAIGNVVKHPLGITGTWRRKKASRVERLWSLQLFILVCLFWCQRGGRTPTRLPSADLKSFFGL
jgi:hypothetical protein